MEYTFLSKNVEIKKVSENETEGTFEILNLYTGYGITMGNALRRVLLSSLPGAAVTQIKIKGVKHEFSTAPNVLEDIVDIMMNVKKLRFRFFAQDAQTLVIKKKGEGPVTGADIQKNPDVEVVNTDQHIATITTKTGEFEMEMTIEKGLGYASAENRKTDKLPVGSIALDAIFTPVKNVNFTVENMRVGDRTDYNKLTMTIKTDGTISPSRVLHKAANVLADHLGIVSEVDINDFGIVHDKKEAKEEKETKKKK